MDRPLLGCNLGMFLDERYPRTAQSLPDRPLEPDDLDEDAFLADCEDLYRRHVALGDDYPYTGCALKFVPWMEAIMGCPIKASLSSMWAEPCADSLADCRRRLAPEGRWARKLLQMLQAVADDARGRYPVSATLMRGPADILSAMRGAAEFPLDVMDFPEEVKRTLDLCAEVWVEIEKAQLAIMPESERGYFDGDRGMRFWAPQKPIWLQEDAAALLSPRIYRGFLLPVDRRIAANFSASAFHIHGVTHWMTDDVLSAPKIDVVEIDFDDARTAEDVDRVFAACQRILAQKRLIAYRNYDEGFWPWLDRAIAELRGGSLSIQTSVRDLEEGILVKSRFLERFNP